MATGHWLTDRPTDRSVGRSVSRSVSQSVSQSKLFVRTSVFQGGIFKLVHTAKGETKIQHNSIYKAGFKALTMIPALEESLSNDKIMAYTDYLQNLQGFETLAVYKLHDCSGPAKEWFYHWIIEAFYNSVNTWEDSVLKDLINCPMADKKWELSIHKDYVQMAG